MDVRESIRNYIVENFLFGDSEPLSSDDLSLLESGIIDSVGVMELVAELEGTFGVTVDDAELIPENLDSISNLVQFISRKKVA